MRAKARINHAILQLSSDMCLTVCVCVCVCYYR